MTAPTDLRLLSAAEPAAPFGFAQFEQRRAALGRRSRLRQMAVASALAVVAIVPLIAVLTQPAPAARVIAPSADQLMPLADVFQQPPALVDMRRFAITSELEDYIALLDAQISAARLAAVPREELRRLETTRAQLHDSLQRVSHAHALLDL